VAIATRAAIDVRVQVGLLGITLLSCAAEAEPSAPSMDCSNDASAGLLLGAFGNSAQPLPSDAHLQTWVPLQGGVVVGLDLLATGVPSGANKLAITISRSDGSEQLGFLSYRAAHFLCSEGGYLTWRRGMIPIESPSVHDAQELDGQAVLVDVEARFPLPDGDATELTLHQLVTLDEGAPSSY
jgi:hypothetical protein